MRRRLDFSREIKGTLLPLGEFYRAFTAFRAIRVAVYSAIAVLATIVGLVSDGVGLRDRFFKISSDTPLYKEVPFYKGPPSTLDSIDLKYTDSRALLENFLRFRDSRDPKERRIAHDCLESVIHREKSEGNDQSLSTLSTMMGHYLLQQSHSAKAIPWLENASKLNPENQEARGILLNAYQAESRALRQIRPWSEARQRQIDELADKIDALIKELSKQNLSSLEDFSSSLDLRLAQLNSCDSACRGSCRDDIGCDNNNQFFIAVDTSGAIDFERNQAVTGTGHAGITNATRYTAFASQLSDCGSGCKYSCGDGIHCGYNWFLEAADVGGLLATGYRAFAGFSGAAHGPDIAGALAEANKIPFCARGQRGTSYTYTYTTATRQAVDGARHFVMPNGQCTDHILVGGPGTWANTSDLERYRARHFTTHGVLAVGVNGDGANTRLTRLRHADQDAQRVATALRGLDFHSTVLVNAAATKSKILAELSHVVQASKPGDEFVFYFSGHGFTGIDGQPVLVTGGNTVASTAPEILSLVEVNNLLSHHRGRALVILDNCLNQTGFDFDVDINHDIYVRSQHLAGPNPPTFLLAGAPGSRAIESPRLGSGLFTYTLLRYLEQQRRGDHLALDFAAMYRYTATETSRLARELYGVNQRPQWLLVKTQTGSSAAQPGSSPTSRSTASSPTTTR